MQKRPIFLSAALSLSLIGSTVNFVAFSLVFLFFEKISASILSVTHLLSMEGASSAYFAGLALLSGLSLAGVILMWNYMRTGLYIYLAAQVLLLIFPPIWLGRNSLSAMSIVFTSLFVGIYLTYFRYFK